MPSQTINVFVSYSHADASLVAPVVRLLRVNRSLVFQDTDGIPPGKRWRAEIAKALAESDLVVVFWCHHAFRSNEVSVEWRAAIEQDKDLLPLLLDATPLPSELGNFQWIDFRGTVGANHSTIDSPAAAVWPMAASPRRAVWYILAGVAAAAVAVSIVPRASSVTGSVNVVPISCILFLLGAVGVGALGAYLLRIRHRLTKRDGRRIGSARPHLEEIERRIAVKLEAEILRRTASGQDGGA